MKPWQGVLIGLIVVGAGFAVYELFRRSRVQSVQYSPGSTEPFELAVLPVTSPSAITLIDLMGGIPGMPDVSGVLPIAG